MLLVSISCDYKKCEKFLSKNDVQILKDKLVERYGVVFSERKLCSFLNYFDSIIEESNHYDLYYSDHYFKYFGIAFYGLSICIVKNETGSVFLFTNNYVDDLVKFNNENYGLIPEVDFENFNIEPEFVEFNALLKSIRVVKPSYFYINMLHKCFQEEGAYGMLYPVFQGPLDDIEFENWVNEHLVFDLKWENNYDYFSIGSFALARMTYTGAELNCELIMKALPNDIKIMYPDTRSNFVRDCN